MISGQTRLLLLVAAVTVVESASCPGASASCDCGWTNNGANCGSDDGSECFCRCCCAYKGSCNWQSGGGGGGGGTCAMPSGVPSAPPAKNNANFVGCHGKLSLGGRGGLQLVDEHGAAVQLMGMSSHGLHWFDSCYTKASIQFIVENWGVNLFRAAMYVGEGGYASNSALKNKVKDIVQWCKELGIYVMIDWHILNPGNPNDGTYSGAESFWKEMATLYKGEKHVLYEIANEPNGVGWSDVKAYHNKIIAAIRSIDTETIIICGTPTWSQEVDKPAADPVAQPRNVMYTFHFYAGSHLSLLQNIVTYSSRVPIFVTEWGTSQASGDGGPYLPETKQFLDTFAKVGSLGLSLSWAQWSFADKSEVSAALKPGSCASQKWDDTSCSGTFLKNYIKANVATCGSTPPTTSAPVPPTNVPVVTGTPRTSAPVVTTSAPVATNTPSGQCKEWDACLNSPGCCPSGTKCYKNNEYYAQCRSSCPPDWDCTVLGSGVPPPPPPPVPVGCSQPIANYGACLAAPSCCASGLTCFEQSQYYAQCLATCPTSGWTCRNLGAAGSR